MLNLSTTFKEFKSFKSCDHYLITIYIYQEIYLIKSINNGLDVNKFRNSSSPVS